MTVHDKIEALNEKVRERDADLVRERETAQALLQRNGNIGGVQETLISFGAQIEEVVGKVDTVVAGQYRQDDQSVKDTNTK